MYQEWLFFKLTGRELGVLVFSANNEKRYDVTKPGTVQLE